MIKNFFAHLHTVNKHRFLVMKLCFKMGLYRQGLLHDLSKYSPAEFIPGVRYFQGTRSPIAAERRDIGFSLAWTHHQINNRHHWQYWLRYNNGNYDDMHMPENYIKEMVCDRIAACMVYQKNKYHKSSALEFFHNGNESQYMPRDVYEKLERCLKIVAENELDDALKIIRKTSLL